MGDHSRDKRTRTLVAAIAGALESLCLTWFDPITTLMSHRDLTRPRFCVPVMLRQPKKIIKKKTGSANVIKLMKNENFTNYGKPSPCPCHFLFWSLYIYYISLTKIKK